MKTSSRSFTLLELIVVIIILGTLAILGFSQYWKALESARLVEAEVRIGNMRQLVTEYYLKNGSLDGIVNADAGVDDTCAPSNFYKYRLNTFSSTGTNLVAIRCASGGKTPNASRQYVYYLAYYPATGQAGWYCYWSDDSSSCFGLPPFEE